MKMFMVTIKRYLNPILMIILLCIILVACKDSVNNWDGNIRIELLSSESRNVSISIIIESESGNSIDGALVYVNNGDNSNVIIKFDNNKKCYYGLLENPKNENFFVSIKSTLFGKRTFVIPHYELLKPPVLEVFCDSDGNSYFLGNALNIQKDIRISWNSDIDDCIFKVIIRNATDTIFESSTNNTTIEIPANTLNNDSQIYYLKIQQQKIYGDLLFEKQQYYSVSIISTDNYIFSLY